MSRSATKLLFTKRQTIFAGVRDFKSKRFKSQQHLHGLLSQALLSCIFVVSHLVERQLLHHVSQIR
ncbi:hypothetical protein B9Z31_04015 [Limnohabitans sp. G3-2]|nr:hypothetical protein B9Z31_04015 [Limnohabitans sp. G3-2]